MKFAIESAIELEAGRTFSGYHVEAMAHFHATASIPEEFCCYEETWNCTIRIPLFRNRLLMAK
jgi:hypothetical protein